MKKARIRIKEPLYRNNPFDTMKEDEFMAFMQEAICKVDVGMDATLHYFMETLFTGGKAEILARTGMADRTLENHLKDHHSAMEPHNVIRIVVGLHLPNPLGIKIAMRNGYALTDHYRNVLLYRFLTERWQEPVEDVLEDWKKRMTLQKKKK